MKNNYLVQAWLVLILAVAFGGALAGVKIALQPRIDQNQKDETLQQVPTLIGMEDLPPESVTANLEVTVGDEGTAHREDIFGAPVEAVASSGEAVDQDNDIQRLIDRYGFWGYLIALGLAFLTGLLLSFSPCTYPMIPITVSIFAGQDRSVGRGFVLSLFYVGSMAVVYGIMGLIVSLVGGVFGAWLASKPVVIGIAVVFVVFSLSMFGLYELQVPQFLLFDKGYISVRE